MLEIKFVCLKALCVCVFFIRVSFNDSFIYSEKAATKRKMNYE